VRRRSLLPLVIAALALTGGCDDGSDGEGASGEGQRTAEERGAPELARLVERLRGGNHVLLFRHAATDSAFDMTDDLTDCSRQRNLNAEGRRQSRTVGAVLRRLEIPVGRVLASPFCRTRHTARLAAGSVRASRALLSPEFFANERQRQGLRRLLAIRPRRGTNAMLVSHEAAIQSATRVAPEEGEAVIVAPGRGPRGFRIVSRVTADEWEALARSP
jgi:phosphohistidine phosphatase SixA